MVRFALFLLVLLSGCAVVRPGCAPPGSWIEPSTLKPVTNPLDAARLPPVILLAEQHDSAADHDWQLKAIRHLYKRGVRLILGFEQFPRSAQTVLDAWVRGDLSEADFLRRSNWHAFWGFPAEPYLPIFRFARDNHIPMRALNISHALVHMTYTKGWAAVQAPDREGIGNPAPPSPAYRATLSEAMASHGGPKMTPDALRRFIDAQLLWDRAMAEGIAATHRADPAATIVALMGQGHVQDRDGVAHQLAPLGLPNVLALIPAHDVCAPEQPGFADAIYTD
jgi:uncharacterized iron-regulated protein